MSTKADRGAAIQSGAAGADSVLELDSGLEVQPETWKPTLSPTQPPVSSNERLENDVILNNSANPALQSANIISLTAVLSGGAQSAQQDANRQFGIDALFEKSKTKRDPVDDFFAELIAKVGALRAHALRQALDDVIQKHLEEHQRSTGLDSKASLESILADLERVLEKGGLLELYQGQAASDKELKRLRKNLKSFAEEALERAINPVSTRTIAVSAQREISDDREQKQTKVVIPPVVTIDLNAVLSQFESIARQRGELLAALERDPEALKNSERSLEQLFEAHKEELARHPALEAQLRQKYQVMEDKARAAFVAENMWRLGIRLRQASGIDGDGDVTQATKAVNDYLKLQEDLIERHGDGFKAGLKRQQQQGWAYCHDAIGKAYAAAAELKVSMKGGGTYEDRFDHAIENLNGFELYWTRLVFDKKYGDGSNWQEWIEGDFSGRAETLRIERMSGKDGRAYLTVPKDVHLQLREVVDTPVSEHVEWLQRKVKEASKPGVGKEIEARLYSIPVELLATVLADFETREGKSLSDALSQQSSDMQQTFADDVRKAVEGHDGAAFGSVVATFENVTPGELQAHRQVYEALTGQSLMLELSRFNNFKTAIHFTGQFEDSGPIIAAMELNDFISKNDEDPAQALLRYVRFRNPEQMKVILDAYQERYGINLIDEVLQQYQTGMIDESLSFQQLRDCREQFRSQHPDLTGTDLDLNALRAFITVARDKREVEAVETGNELTSGAFAIRHALESDNPIAMIDSITGGDRTQLAQFAEEYRRLFDERMKTPEEIVLERLEKGMMSALDLQMSLMQGNVSNINNDVKQKYNVFGVISGHRSAVERHIGETSEEVERQSKRADEMMVAVRRGREAREKIEKLEAEALRLSQAGKKEAAQKLREQQLKLLQETYSALDNQAVLTASAEYRQALRKFGEDLSGSIQTLNNWETGLKITRNVVVIGGACLATGGLAAGWIGAGSLSGVIGTGATVGVFKAATVSTIGVTVAMAPGNVVEQGGHMYHSGKNFGDAARDFGRQTATDFKDAGIASFSTAFGQGGANLTSGLLTKTGTVLVGRGGQLSVNTARVLKGGDIILSGVTAGSSGAGTGSIMNTAVSLATGNEQRSWNRIGSDLWWDMKVGAAGGFIGAKGTMLKQGRGIMAQTVITGGESVATGALSLGAAHLRNPERPLTWDAVLHESLMAGVGVLQGKMAAQHELKMQAQRAVDPAVARALEMAPPDGTDDLSLSEGNKLLADRAKSLRARLAEDGRSLSRSDRRALQNFVDKTDALIHQLETHKVNLSQSDADILLDRVSRIIESDRGYFGKLREWSAVAHDIEVQGRRDAIRARLTPEELATLSPAQARDLEVLSHDLAEGQTRLSRSGRLLEIIKNRGEAFSLMADMRRMQLRVDEICNPLEIPRKISAEVKSLKELRGITPEREARLQSENPDGFTALERSLYKVAGHNVAMQEKGLIRNFIDYLRPDSRSMRREFAVATKPFEFDLRRVELVDQERDRVLKDFGVTSEIESTLRRSNARYSAVMKDVDLVAQRRVDRQNESFWTRFIPRADSDLSSALRRIDSKVWDATYITIKNESLNAVALSMHDLRKLPAAQAEDAIYHLKRLARDEANLSGSWLLKPFRQLSEKHHARNFLDATEPLVYAKNRSAYLDERKLQFRKQNDISDAVAEKLSKEGNSILSRIVHEQDRAAFRDLWSRIRNIRNPEIREWKRQLFAEVGKIESDLTAAAEKASIEARYAKKGILPEDLNKLPDKRAASGRYHIEQAAKYEVAARESQYFKRVYSLMDRLHTYLGNNIVEPVSHAKLRPEIVEKGIVDFGKRHGISEEVSKRLSQEARAALRNLVLEEDRAAFRNPLDRMRGFNNPDIKETKTLLFDEVKKIKVELRAEALRSVEADIYASLGLRKEDLGNYEASHADRLAHHVERAARSAIAAEESKYFRKFHELREIWHAYRAQAAYKLISPEINTAKTDAKTVDARQEILKEKKLTLEELDSSTRISEKARIKANEHLAEAARHRFEALNGRRLIKAWHELLERYHSWQFDRKANPILREHLILDKSLEYRNSVDEKAIREQHKYEELKLASETAARAEFELFGLRNRLRSLTRPIETIGRLWDYYKAKKIITHYQAFDDRQVANRAYDAELAARFKRAGLANAGDKPVPAPISSLATSLLELERKITDPNVSSDFMMSAADELARLKAQLRDVLNKTADNGDIGQSDSAFVGDLAGQSTVNELTRRLELLESEAAGYKKLKGRTKVDASVLEGLQTEIASVRGRLAEIKLSHDIDAIRQEVGTFVSKEIGDRIAAETSADRPTREPIELTEVHREDGSSDSSSDNDGGDDDGSVSGIVTETEPDLPGDGALSREAQVALQENLAAELRKQIRRLGEDIERGQHDDHIAARRESIKDLRREYLKVLRQNDTDGEDLAFSRSDDGPPHPRGGEGADDTNSRTAEIEQEISRQRQLLDEDILSGAPTEKVEWREDNIDRLRRRYKKISGGDDFDGGSESTLGNGDRPWRPKGGNGSDTALLNKRVAKKQNARRNRSNKGDLDFDIDTDTSRRSEELDAPYALGEEHDYKISFEDDNIDYDSILPKEINYEDILPREVDYDEILPKEYSPDGNDSEPLNGGSGDEGGGTATAVKTKTKTETDTEVETDLDLDTESSRAAATPEVEPEILPETEVKPMEEVEPAVVDSDAALQHEAVTEQHVTSTIPRVRVVHGPLPPRLIPDLVPSVFQLRKLHPENQLEVVIRPVHRKHPAPHPRPTEEEELVRSRDQKRRKKQQDDDSEQAFLAEAQQYAKRRRTEEVERIKASRAPDIDARPKAEPYFCENSFHVRSPVMQKTVGCCPSCGMRPYFA